MENKVYKITLADGTEIENLSLNGNNFISSEAIDENVFEDNCTPVTISDSETGETVEIYKNAELVQLKEVNGEYWFILRDVSEKELAERQLRSDVEYLAMMCGVEL